MSGTVDRLAWPVCVLAMGSALASLGFLAASGPGRVPVATHVGLAVSMTAFAVVGALIASRQSRHPVGWLFLAIALGVNVASAAGEYGRFALLTHPGTLPGGIYAAWLGSWLFGTAITSNLFLLLLFPTGSLPSPRWRPLLWLSALVILVLTIVTALAPGPLGYEFSDVGLANPFGITAIGQAAPVLDGVFQPLFLAVVLSTVALLVVRARRAREVERQQLKWFAYAVGLMIAVNFLLNPLVEEYPALTDLPFSIGIGVLPVMTGIAILRWRLYDIDLVINRTLVYGSLTVLLGVVYVSSVLVLSRLLRVEGNDLAVAAATLAVAALFSPARRRIQALVDRRFYRSRYDARQAVEELSARLRDRHELEAVLRQVEGVVRGTLTPALVGMWLKPVPETEGPR